MLKKEKNFKDCNSNSENEKENSKMYLRYGDLLGHQLIEGKYTSIIYTKNVIILKVRYDDLITLQEDYLL